MKYDFTTVLDRRGKDSTAADVIPFANAHVKEGFEPIPMWVADMSLPVAPSVEAAIKKRMEMPNYGYFQLPDSYYDSIISWQSRRNAVEGLEKKHIGYENDVQDGFYMTCFDVEKIDRMDMDAETDGVMRAVFLKEVFSRLHHQLIVTMALG